ncbi:MAG: purine-nucleoside phosphorylase [Desulfofustis sp.]|nr:purine-nucleoside phosphorylase [Desulfofustis sp.]
MELIAQVKEGAAYVEERIGVKPRLGIVLGSGLGALGERVEEPVVIPYGEIPHFHGATVQGHSGRLLTGMLQGQTVMVLQGRPHYYEGLSMDQVVFPVRCMRMLGVDNLIVTNAAGSLNPDFRPGDLMLIRDHIKMVTDSPLRGVNIDEFGPRFNDMSDPYSKEIRDLAKQCGESLGFELKEGVYCYMPGPSYETASEVRMLGLLGGHAVGMSTVPEVITAVHAGMKVLGISCITNMGTGILDQPLHHDEIIRVGEQVRKTFITLLESIVRSWPLNKAT